MGKLTEMLDNLHYLLAGLLIFAVLLCIWLIFNDDAPKLTTTSTSGDAAALVHKFQLNDKDEIEVEITDEKGKEIELFEVDPFDPIGSARKRQEKDVLSIISGRTVLLFSSRNSPGCLTTCMGNVCGKKCN